MTQCEEYRRNNLKKFFYIGYILIIEILKHKYKKYKDKMLSKVFKKVVNKPWMRYKEIDIIEEILKNLQPKNCMEWGAGYSTIYFPKFLKKNAKWISIEHDKDWAIKIKKINKNSKVKIFHIQPNHFPWRDMYGNGTYSEFRRYLEFPTMFAKFNYILIDGRARNDCLIKAHELIENEGVVILHDANRKFYHESFKLYKYQVLFEDYRKDEGGLWVGSKGINIEDLLDVSKHRTLWQIYNKFSKKTLGCNWAKSI